MYNFILQGSIFELDDPFETPTAPSGLSFTDQSTNTDRIGGSFTDNASPPSEETHHLVEYSTASNFSSVAGSSSIDTDAYPTPEATNFQFTSLTQNTIYYVRISAVNRHGSSSYLTGDRCTVPATPGAPALSSVTGTSMVITFSSSGNAPSTQYIYEVATDSGFSNVVSSGTTSQSSVTPSNLQNLTTYYVRYKIRNRDEIGAFGTSANETTLSDIPTAPSNLAIGTLTTASIALSWVDNSNNEDGFDIARATNSSFTSGIGTDTVTANVTTFNKTGLSAATRYYFKVRASSATTSSSAYTSVVNSFTLPDAPTNPALNGSAAYNSVPLTWTAPSGTISHYVLQRSTNGGSSYSDVDTNISGTTYTDSGPTANTTNIYRIAAVTNPGGQGAYSSTLSVSVPAAPPSAPTITSLTPTISGNTRELTLVYSNVANETSYTAEYSTASDFSSTAHTTTESTDDLTSVWSSPNQGTTYYARVKANNASGSSAYSSSANALTHPGASTITMSSTGTTTLSLAFTNPSGTDTGIKVYRSQFQDTDSFQAEASPLATTVNMTSPFTSTGTTSLDPGTKYYYRVKVYNGTGNGPYSNIDSATTSISAPAAPTITNDSIGLQSIALSSAVTGATFYNIYGGTTSNPTTAVLEGIGAVDMKPVQFRNTSSQSIGTSTSETTLTLNSESITSTNYEIVFGSGGHIKFTDASAYLVSVTVLFDDTGAEIFTDRTDITLKAQESTDNATWTDIEQGFGRCYNRELTEGSGLSTTFLYAPSSTNTYMRFRLTKQHNTSIDIESGKTTVNIVEIATNDSSNIAQFRGGDGDDLSSTSASGITVPLTETTGDLPSSTNHIIGLSSNTMTIQETGVYLVSYTIPVVTIGQGSITRSRIKAGLYCTVSGNSPGGRSSGILAQSHGSSYARKDDNSGDAGSGVNSTFIVDLYEDEALTLKFFNENGIEVETDNFIPQINFVRLTGDAMMGPTRPVCYRETSSTDISNYQTGGWVADQTSGWNVLDVQTTDFSNASYKNGANSIEVKTAGTFLISYTIPIDEDTSNEYERNTVRAKMQKSTDGGSTWSDITGSEHQIYTRENNGTGGSGLSSTFLADLTATTPMEIRLLVAQADAYSTNTTTDISTHSGQSQVSMICVKDNNDITATGEYPVVVSNSVLYYYRVKAGGFDATSSYSSQSSLTSSAGLSAPSITSIDSTSTTSQTITWGSVSGATQYQLYGGTSSNPTSLIVTNSGSPPLTSHTRTGLSAQTKYYYRLKSGDGTSTSSYGTEQFGIMTPGSLSLSTSNISSTGFTVSWSALSPSANISRYEYRFGTSNPPTGSFTSNGTSTSFNVVALASTTIYVQVRAVTLDYPTSNENYGATASTNATTLSGGVSPPGGGVIRPGSGSGSGDDSKMSAQDPALDEELGEDPDISPTSWDTDTAGLSKGTAEYPEDALNDLIGVGYEEAITHLDGYMFTTSGGTPTSWAWTQSIVTSSLTYSALADPPYFNSSAPTTQGYTRRLHVPYGTGRGGYLRHPTGDYVEVKMSCTASNSGGDAAATRDIQIKIAYDG